MKLRAVRCHQTGRSNRSEYQDHGLNTSQRAYSLMDSTAGKLSTNPMNKTAVAGGQTFKSTANSLTSKKYSASMREASNPLSKTNIFTNQQRNIESVYNGEDMQLQNKRFETANFKQNQFALSYDGSRGVPNMIEPLEASLNKEVREIRRHFQGKDVNMHKLKEIKRAFLQNFADKHHIKQYYEKYARGDGKIDKTGLKNLVKDFGFYATDDEVNLMLSLTKNKVDTSAQSSIEDFITLTSKPNIYFQTLKLQDPHSTLHTKPRIFTKKIHLLLRNSFLRLRQAMRIYDQQSIPLTQSQFHKVFKKLDLTDLVISKKQIDDLYSQFTNPNGCVNQEKLLGAIAEQENLNILAKKRPFEVEFEDNLTRHKEIKEMVEGNRGVEDLRGLANADYEKQIKRVRGMVADVRKVWKEKGDFQKIIGAEVGAVRGRGEVREKIEKVMQHAGLNYSKKDYDALMACFKYNINGGTKLDDVVSTLYDQSQQAFDDRMDRRCRNLPPNLSSDNPSQFPIDYNDPTLQQGLSKIDTKLLHNQFVKTFKAMDTDKDGYVSIRDFENAMQKKEILTGQEMSSVINYLDQDGKGYLTFQQVQEKLHPNIVNEIKKTSLPTLLSKFSTKQKWLDSKRTFIATSNQYQYSIPSKYSAWPKNLCTTDLSLIQPSDTSGMHMTQRQRFNVRQKDSYGAEDKKRAQSINDSKVQRKAGWENQVNQRAERNREEEFRKEQQVNHLKRLAQEIYERNCHKQQ